MASRTKKQIIQFNRFILKGQLTSMRTYLYFCPTFSFKEGDIIKNILENINLFLDNFEDTNEKTFDLKTKRNKNA